ncbi:MAG TPA: cytidine deaminase [Agriterribacter sp.]|nr:cytidine deaminase [Agriterribacter sp.]
MKQAIIPFSYEIVESAELLPGPEWQLLRKAQEMTHNAYAPYSQFFVGAALLLRNGKIVMGTNQENASSPAGLCAERVALAAAASLHPGISLLMMAITHFNNGTGKSEQPIAPCGICRQSLLEYEINQQQPIRLILGALNGEVLLISSVKSLLPLSFSGADLK